MGLLDSFDPQTQGLLAAAFQGLQASGPSRMPMSLGQIIGQGGMAGLSSYAQANESARKNRQTEALIELEKQKAAMEAAKMAKMERDSKLLEKILSSGLTGGANADTLESIGILGNHPSLLTLADRKRKETANAETMKSLQSQVAPITDVPQVGIGASGAVGSRSIIPQDAPAGQIPPEVQAAAQSGKPFSIGVGPSANPAENLQRVGGLFSGDYASQDQAQAQQGLLGQNLVDQTSGRSVNPQHFIDMQARLAVSAAQRQQQKFMADAAVANRPQEPLTAIVGPDNKPVLVSRSEALGKTPASASAMSGSDVIPPEHTNLTGKDYLATLPQGMQNNIVGIAEGRIPITSFSIRNNQRAEMLQRVAQYDPTFEAGKAPARMAVYKDFTSGPTSKNVTAINTGIAHLGSMGELAQALNNGTVPAINKAVQFVKVQTGDPAVTNFDTAKQAVATELMRVFRQVNASETEMKDWEKKFLTAGSPAQIQGAMKVAATLLKGRIDAVNDMWDRGMDKTGGYPQLLSPRSKAVMAQYGVDYNASSPTDIRAKADAILRGQ